jgi:hypothetical protein
MFINHGDLPEMGKRLSAERRWPLIPGHSQTWEARRELQLVAGRYRRAFSLEVQQGWQRRHSSCGWWRGMSEKLTATGASDLPEGKPPANPRRRVIDALDDAVQSAEGISLAIIGQFSLRGGDSSPLTRLVEMHRQELEAIVIGR